MISNGEVLEAAEVPGYPGYFVTRDGRILGKKGEWMKTAVDETGHHSIITSYGRKKRRFLFIHRAVLLAWVGPCPDGMEGCHNDGNPENNSVDNLRWDTRSANQYDRWRHARVINPGGVNAHIGTPQ